MHDYYVRAAPRANRFKADQMLLFKNFGAPSLPRVGGPTPPLRCNKYRNVEPRFRRPAFFKNFAHKHRTGQRIPPEPTNSPYLTLSQLAEDSSPSRSTGNIKRLGYCLASFSVLPGKDIDDLRDEFGSEFSSTAAAENYDKSAFANLTGCPCDKSGYFEVAGRIKPHVSVFARRPVIAPVPKHQFRAKRSHISTQGFFDQFDIDIITDPVRNMQIHIVLYFLKRS